MKTRLAALVLSAAAMALADDCSAPRRVLSETPTVVTVEASQDAVPLRAERNEGKRVKPWGRAAQFAGWMMNVDGDTIPSRREREQRARYAATGANAAAPKLVR
jgi:hypothetical protein